MVIKCSYGEKKKPKKQNHYYQVNLVTFFVTTQVPIYLNDSILMTKFSPFWDYSRYSSFHPHISHNKVSEFW